MKNQERESEDAQDSSKELRGVAPPAMTKNEGLLITPKGKVDNMEIDDSSPIIRNNSTRSLSNPNVQ